MNNRVKKIASIALAGVLASGVTAACFGCGNMDITDMHYTFGYAVVEENGHHVLHQVAKWSDSDSESLTISTTCCRNYIWTSANNAVLYENKPADYCYDLVCGEKQL